MVRLLLGLDAVPTPHDAADALAVAICHVHTQCRRGRRRREAPARAAHDGAARRRRAGAEELAA